MARPDLSKVAKPFHNYINQVPEDDLLEAFRNNSGVLFDFLNSIPADKRDFRYGPDKWTIKEIVLHLIDAERVFAYRALRFARKDGVALNGFDENVWAENSKYEQRDWNELIEEYKVVRKSSEYLFGTFDKEQIMSEGIAGDNPNTSLGLGYAIVGHGIHHSKIIRERYL